MTSEDERRREHARQARLAACSIVGSGPPPERPFTKVEAAPQGERARRPSVERQEPVSPLIARRRELWTEQYLAKSRWVLAEALAWIVWRVGETAAAALDYGKSDLLSDHADILDAVLSLSASDDQAAETQPLEALKLELIRGTVRGSYDVEDYVTFQTRPIPVSSWENLEFRRSDGRSILWDARAIDPRDGPRLHLVYFERASVQAAFPAESAHMQDQSWPMRPGEDLTNWMARPEVEAEKLRRAGAAKGAGDRALAAMAAESGRPTTPASLKTLRLRFARAVRGD